MNIKKLCGLTLLPLVILSSCSNPTSNSTISDNSIKANSLFDVDLNKIFGQDLNQQTFQWGVSTAGYQGEGNDNSSMWHQWDISGKTTERNPKGVDFFNRYQEDIDLAKNMGVNSFRLSIEWSRIEPRKGYFDPQGIQFYHNVINAIKSRGMTPLVTLVHFNYPQWVLDQTKGKGLESSDFINYYLKYTEKAVTEFGPDVKYWLTFNEPNIWVPGAYLLGQTPPGKKNPLATLRATWNLLKAHSKAYDLIHKLDSDAMVSSNVFYVLPKPFGPITPAPDPNNPEKLAATTLDEKNITDTDWFYESINSGNVKISPQVFASENLQVKANTTSKTLAQELSETDIHNNPIKGQVNAEMDSSVGSLKKFDYVAFDYYYRFRTINQVLNLAKPWLMESYPSGLYDAIMYYQRKYNKPIMIAENGIATEDLKPRSDKWTREASLVQHIKYMKQAMADGANVLGYYHWSITDNYEWGSFKPRFGLYAVNAATDPTMKRIETPSVKVYADIIKNNGVTTNLLSTYKAPNM